MSTTVRPSRCLACGGSDLELWAVARDVEYRTTDQEFRYLRCGSCGALSIDPVPADQLARIYPWNYYSFQPSDRSLVAAVKLALDRRIFRAVTKRIPGDGLRALDIGGGAGWQLDVLRAAEPRIVESQIVDIDGAAAEHARRGGHRYFEGRIEDFCSDARYDIVLILNLIEHVEDPTGLLRKIATLLGPTGRIILKTPNVDSLDARLFRHRCWGGLHCPRHWVLFTRPSLERTVARAGLAIEAFAYTQGAPFWTTSVLGVLAKLGLATITAERPAYCHPLAAPLNAFFAGFDFARRPFSRTSQMFAVLRLR